MGSYKGNAWYNVSCLLQMHCHLTTNHSGLVGVPSAWLVYPVMAVAGGWMSETSAWSLDRSWLLLFAPSTSHWHHSWEIKWEVKLVWYGYKATLMGHWELHITKKSELWLCVCMGRNTDLCLTCPELQLQAGSWWSHWSDELWTLLEK